MANIEVCSSRNLESSVNPVLEFLKCARFKKWRVDMSYQKSGISRHLCAVRPSIITHDNDSTTRCPRKVTNRQRIGGYMQTNAFHERNRTDIRHLRAIQACDT